MPLIDSEETARRIGMSIDHYRRTWRSLVVTRGFPRPASPNRRRFQWLEAEVEAWLIRQSRPDMEIGPPPVVHRQPRTVEERRAATDEEIARITRGRTQPPMP